MKKIISFMCALCVLCSLTTISYAAKGTLSLSASYMADDWETSKDKVTAAGDIVMVSVNASDISDMSNITTACDEFSAIQFELTYNKDAIIPYMDTVYESTVFAAKYTNPKKNVPTSTTEGIITTGSVGYTSNTAEPGYVPDGKTTMIINEATSGFALNGDFMLFYFVVVDPAKSGDIGLSFTDGDYFDNAAGKIVPAEVKGISLEGMGATTEEVNFEALDAAIAAFGTKTEADYTAESWAAAKTAYDAAVAAKSATTQAEVDAAATALSNAIAALELKPVDKVTVKPDGAEPVIKKDNASGKWTFGFGGTVEITGTKAFTKLIFALEDTVNSKSGTYTWDFETPISATVSYGLNITGCPVDSNITATVTAE